LNIVFIFSQPILRIVTLKNDAQRTGLAAGVELVFRLPITAAE